MAHRAGGGTGRAEISQVSYSPPVAHRAGGGTGRAEISQ